MESVPEYPTSLHFFKLLYLLCRRNRVTLKVPPTLIMGFGFDKVVLMTAGSLGVSFKPVIEAEFMSHLDAMNVYTSEERLGLPKFLVKTLDEKQPCYSSTETLSVMQRLVTQHEEFVVQPYLLSPQYTPQKVRVTWTLENGSQAWLYANQLTCFGTVRGFSGSAGHRRGRSDVKDTVRNHTTDHLFVSPFTEPSSCTISAATQVLARSVEYVKHLLESSILLTVRGKIKGIQVDMMLDIKGKWYFLGIEEYQVEVGQGKSLPTSPERSLLVQQASAPTPRLRCSIPEIRISQPSIETSPPPLRSKPLPKPKTAYTSLQTTPSHSRKQSPTFPPSNTPFQYILTKGSVSSPKELAQVRDMEKDIAGLIGENAALTHMTYRAWLKRLREGSPRNYSLDQLYAKQLSKQEKHTRELAEDNQRSLKTLKTRLMETLATASLQPNQLLGVAATILLERMPNKKVSKNTEQIQQIQLRLQRKKQVEMNKTAGVRAARDVVTYAARNLDVLKATARVLKQEYQQEMRRSRN